MKGKRLLAMLLAVMMVVTALPMGAFAEEEPVVVETSAEEPAAEPVEKPAEALMDEPADEHTEEPVTDESQLELSGVTLDLYWAKFIGMKDGKPDYSTSGLRNCMNDETGQDINAVFLLGDGTNFTEVPYAELKFPEGLTYSQNSDYANAVYMEFDKVLEGNITYTKDGTTYEFPLKVVSAFSGTIGYYKDFYGASSSSLGQGEAVITGAVGETVTAYFVWDPAETGALEEMLVSFRPAGMDTNLLDTQPIGDTAATLADYNVTLTLNAQAGYVQVQAVIGNSINVGLAPVFNNSASRYWLSIDPENESSDEEEQEQPSFQKGTGLYCFGFQGMEDGKPAYDYSDVDTSMQDEVGEDIEVVFVFWDGETAIEIAPDQLVFPENLKYEVSDEYQNAVYIEFDTTLDEVITYNKGDDTYAFSVVIDMPYAGFYSAPQRTVEKLVTTGLRYTGKDVDDEGKKCTVYYILADGKEVFTRIEVMLGDSEANTDEARVKLADDGKSALLYIYEDVDFDSTYKVSLYQDSQRAWRRGFSVSDQRPGLYCCSRGDIQNVLGGNTASLNKTMEMEINGTYARAFFFVDDTGATLLDGTADLDFGEYAEAEWESSENCFYLQMSKFGSHSIVYTHKDGEKYAMSVTVTLPMFGVYPDKVASEEDYQNGEVLFTGDPTVAYLVCKESGCTITGLKPDAKNTGVDMDFLTYSIESNGQYIKLEIDDTVVFDKEYTMEVYFKDARGRENDDRVSFTVVKKEPALLWFPVEEDENGGYNVVNTDVHCSKLTCQPGDSLLMQIRWFNGAEYTVLDLDEVKMPAFLTAETVDADNGILRLTCDSLGVGEITSDLCSGLVIDVSAAVADVLAFYTQPERNPAYEDKDFNGETGAVVTRYLMWDQTLLPNVDRVTVTIKDGEGNAEKDMDVATANLSTWDMELTLNLENGWAKVDATMSGWRNVTFKVWQGDQASAEINVNLDENYDKWRGKELVLEYNTGNGIIPLTVNMGRIRNGYVNLGGWNSLGGIHDTLEHDLILGALAFAGTNAESDAPSSFYNAISDVRFEVVRYVNEDGSGDQTESNIRFGEVYSTKYNTMTLPAVQILADPGKFGHILAKISFTLTIDGEATTYTLYETFSYMMETSFEIDMSELNTADKLNAVLGTADGLMDWLKDEDPATRDAILSLLAQDEVVELELILPPVEYTDIICYRMKMGAVRLTLCGSEDNDGNRTTLPGLRTENTDGFFLSDLDFKADSQITQRYGGEEFTCGVLMYGAENSDIYKVMNCRFEGFDYGVRTTATGYTCCWDCEFVDCSMAYLLDSAGKERGNTNADMKNCRFVSCGTAVRIKGLPEGITPYGYRLYNCDFLGNDMDIDVSQPGRFYCYKNYFGDIHTNVDVVDDASDVHKRPPRVRGRGYAYVVVNPRWRDPVTLDGSNHESNHLIVDTKHGLANYMFNSEAYGYNFDSGTLNTDLSKQTEDVSLAMTNDQEETLGTWDIAGGETQTSLLSLFAEETTVADTFCPALDIDENKDGSISVTVDDSDLFDQRKVTLTIPADFIQATVLLNEAAVESVTANGQVTFTVTNGGTYVISEALTEETLNNSFVSGGAVEEDAPAAVVDVGWYDFNAQQTGEKTSFVSMTTQKQDVVKEVDPNEDLKVEEDENGEWIGEETETTEIVTVQAIYQAPVTDDPQEDIQITVLLVLYDSNGRMVAMQEQSAKQNDGTKVITVECDASLIGTDAVQVRAFVISADGSMSPLAPVPFSQTLEIPQ